MISSANECNFYRRTSSKKAIVDSRLRPWCATRDMYLLIFIVEQNSIEIDAVVSAVTLRDTNDAPRNPLCENMTSATKPEVHSVSQRRRRMTEPWPQATGTKIR